ncbi:MAG: hypothetical protein M5U34_18320 [Chloroflexi bacterium]|nr:hypothetical protein [Chloroflexota bacterium]
MFVYWSFSSGKNAQAHFVYSNDNKMPPKIHNLLKIAEYSDLMLTEDQKLFLDEVNDFNLEVDTLNIEGNSTNFVQKNLRRAILLK